MTDAARWQQVQGLPEQVEAAIATTRAVGDFPSVQGVDSVVVIGIGSSGVASEVLLATAARLMPVPVVPVKSFECPSFVSDSTLVFALSETGDTEETIQAASDAAVAGARMVVVTGDGELRRLGESWGATIVPVPADLPHPRTAIGALAIPPLVVLEAIGLYPGAAYWLREAVTQLKARRDQLVAAGRDSLAADVARQIGSTIPLVHGGGAIGVAAATRWCAQIRQNANVPAFWSVQPELSYDEIAGWGRYRELTSRTFSAVELRHEGEHPQVERGFDLVEDILRDQLASVLEVRAEGDGDLAQLLDFVIIGDFVSLWMAEEAGVDPDPTQMIGRFHSGL